MADRTPRPYLLKLVSIGNKIESVQIFIGIFCVTSFLVFITLDVAARSILKPIVSAQEFAVFSYIWAVFTGGTIAYRKDSHFKIDAIVNHLPKRIQSIFNVIDSIFGMIFVYLLIGPGLEFALMGIKRVSNPSGVPLIVPTIAIPFCGLFLLFFLVERLACTLSSWNVRAIRQCLEGNAGGSLK